MRICYIDEAGCPGSLPTATTDVQPVLVVVGLSLPQQGIAPLTIEFLRLKRRFFPALHTGDFLDLVLPEVKGADIRRDAAAPSRRKRRPALQFLGEVFRLLQANDAAVIGRVWIKAPGAPIGPRAIYTSSIQAICTTFQEQLRVGGEQGFVIADSRRKGQNANVAHSIFTQKHSANGDPLDRILEMPTFGHSENHVGLQLADLLSSAVVFPLAIESYSKGHVYNVHTRRDYSRLKNRFRIPLRNMQFRYQRQDGRWTGGLTVSDPIAQRSGGDLFR